MGAFMGPLMAQAETVGFIGLGIMGYPMAANLVKAGYRVAAFNRTRAKAEELAKQGAAVAASPAEVARGARVIFLCVGDSEAVTGITREMLPVIQPGALVIDTSTISPSVSRKIAAEFRARDASFLDAPCTGSKTGATNATLTFMVGGEKEVFERARPYMEAMGKTIIHCGAQGMGLQVKLTQNLIGALSCQAMAEGFVLARKAGLKPSLVLEVLQASVARNPLIEGKMKMVLARDSKDGRIEPHFSLKWMQKDVELMLESARELGVPLPATALVHELFAASIAAGHGEEDFAAAITLLEGMAGVEVSDRAVNEAKSKTVK
jgi:3-hydroxyisobutyrate dehydrogenase-like beta-hydroxyacid dehydrogenase